MSLEECERIGSLLARGEFGSVISACFMHVQAGNTSLSLLYLLSDALHNMTKALHVRGEVQKADWLWKRALDMSSHKNTYILYQYAM